MENLLSRIKKLSEELLPEIIRMRRLFHKNPELSFQEYETSNSIASYLSKIGMEFQTGVAGTGIVLTIKGKNPDKKVLALRADMDALPIKENTLVEYKSTNDGIMHACGHDAHMASLLGTASILHSLKDEFEGSVKLIFQPGEEKLPGGASLMIKEGVLQNPPVKNIFGQHVAPEIEAGKVGFRGGMYMASTDELYITVRGRGGHGAMPHQVIDPVLIAAHVIVSLQQVVSRNASPTLPTVLSFGKIEANGATNVIPSEVKLEGTFRTMDEIWRAEAHSKIEKIAQSIAQGMGGDCEVTIVKGYPFLVNDADLTSNARKNAIHYLGEENVLHLDLRMTAEDFAWYSQEIPSCFYRFGTKSHHKKVTPVHTDTFDIEESSFETSMGLMAWLVIAELNGNHA